MKNNSLHNRHRSPAAAFALLGALALAGCAGVGDIRQGASSGVTAVPPDPFLANLVGRWDIERRIRGKTERNTLDVRWTLGRRFVELHMLDVARPPKYEALVTMGYDASRDRYVAYWTDVYGAQYSGVGYGRRVGDAVDFVFDSPDGTRFHNTFTWVPADGTWRSLMESEDKPGVRAFFAEDRVRRVVSP